MRQADVDRDNLDLPMPRFRGFILSFFTCINVFSAMTSNVQSQASTPIVVLEATSIDHQFDGYVTQRLFVRLTDDGKVEWDEYVGNAWKRQTSSVTAERVSESQRALDSIYRSPIHGTMGPYYMYVDTSTELKIHMTARREDVSFSVKNPWLPSIIPSRKPMPKDVKAVVCEIARLRAQVANTPVNEMCLAPNKSR